MKQEPVHTIVVGADHRGFPLKTGIAEFLEKNGYAVIDVGTHSTEPCDYPLIARKVAEKVAEGAAERGVLICKSGIGMSIAANKFLGIRAGLCCGLEAARLSRQHNDANVIILSADEIHDAWEDLLRVWLTTCFEGGRHKRRVDQISEIERQERLVRRDRGARASIRRKKGKVQ